jgi:putative transposase
MIRYLDEFRGQFGAEQICRTLSATEGGFLTFRGYRAAKTRPRSARAISDELVGQEMVRLHAENYGVYGVRKVHALMRRQGWVLGRDQTGRIMRAHGLRGVKRSKRPDPVGSRPRDLVQRDFKAVAPRRLWVADITCVRTWHGFAYVAFVTDAYSRRIVGWSVAQTLRADILPLQALKMAAFQADGDLTGLTHHSDHGSEGGFNWSSQRSMKESCDGQAGGWMRELTGRDPMRSPGRRGIASRTDRVVFWLAIADGFTTTVAAELAGVSEPVGVRWFRNGGGMPDVTFPRCRGAICRLRSGRRLRCSGRRGSGSGRSRVGYAVRRRRSPGSCAGMWPPVAASLSTGRRSRSGKRRCLRGVRSPRS